MTASNATTKKFSKKKPKPPALQKALLKLQRDHRNTIRAIYRAAGFLRISGIADKQITYENQNFDIDDIFLHENIVVVLEYTCAQSSGVGEHLKNKKHIFDKILASTPKFLQFLETRFPDIAPQIKTNYHASKMVLRIVYCSRNEFDGHYKVNVPGPIYMDYPAVRYFFAVSEAIKFSCRPELLQFLGVEAGQIGKGGKTQVATGSSDYRGSILPEAHSSFDDGYKVVTFYADPEALLRTAYVLRKDGWKDSQNLYQRIISKAKIEAIRQYLKTQKRVFVNNIIVTLPPDVAPLDEKSKTIDMSNLTETAPVTLKLPERANSVGIIDGQHRVFAYHETANDDAEIAQLRQQQNLLVTGIIYPEGSSEFEREKFEARLFLEINSTQTNAKSQLKQAIGLVLEPFSSESIATRVLGSLAKNGPLAGHVEQYFFDNNKLKTSSIVSFALKPLVKTGGAESIFSIWAHPKAAEVAAGINPAALAEYVTFCAMVINRLLLAIKINVPPSRWTSERKVKNRVLTTIFINGFLISLLQIISRGGPSMSRTSVRASKAWISSIYRNITQVSTHV